MGLAHQVGNTVTLSYRGAEFTRVKERNAMRVKDCVRKGKLKVVFNSNPVEFTKDSAVLDVGGQKQTIPNDYVWIFAGGEPPTAFLKKIGVSFGSQNMTARSREEVREPEAVLAPLA